jgi:hypothetical protein
MSDPQNGLRLCPAIAELLSNTSMVAVAEFKPPIAPHIHPDHDGHDCLVLDGLTERTVAWEVLGSPVPGVMEKIGDAVTFRDDIYDASGKAIGRAIGFSTIVDQLSDGHRIGIYQEAVELPDGTFRTSGTIDRTAMLQGGWARFDAVGTGGAYVGKMGIRQWRLAPPLYDPPRPTQHAELMIVLCDGRPRG